MSKQNFIMVDICGPNQSSQKHTQKWPKIGKISIFSVLKLICDVIVISSLMSDPKQCMICLGRAQFNILLQY